MVTTFDTVQLPLTSYQNINNILDNGGFEVWQRGTSFVNPTATAYTTDRWQYTYAGTAPVTTISQESSIVDSGNFSCKINVTSVSGTSFHQFGQPVENYKAYAGKTITLSMRVWSNVAGSGLEIASAAGNFAASSAHPGDSQWHTLTVTYTVAANPSFLLVYFNPVLAAGTHYIDGAMMVVGSNPVTFVPTAPQQDLARCQRYFYATPALTNSYICAGQCANTTGATFLLRFPVPMRSGPTLTVNNVTNFKLWAANGTQISLTSLSNSGASANTDTYLMDGLVASGLVAGNATYLLTNNANAQLFFSADL